jgi:hypothetical protein
LFTNRSGWVELDQIVERTHGNRGYLRVALRLLASCGWLKQRTIESGRGAAYMLTPEGVLGVSLAPPLYSEVVSFMPKAIFVEDFLFGTQNAACNTCCLRCLMSLSEEAFGLWRRRK